MNTVIDDSDSPSVAQTASQDASAHSRALDVFLKASPCPYTMLAQTVLIGSWPRPRVTDAALDELAAELASFLQGPADVGILAIGGAIELRSVECYGRLLCRLLGGLAERDSASDAGLGDPALDRDWDFTFARTKCFVSVFGPLYPADHPRCSRSEDFGYVLFQPEHSFRRFGISSTTPHRADLSQRVQDLFTRAGQPYDIAQVKVPKALRYIKPLRASDASVAWWRMCQ